jgi:hypothetical protein
MSVSNIAISVVTNTTARQCQPCTACCDGWVRINVFDVPVLPGKPCPHSTGPSTKNKAGSIDGGGCKIYTTRPVDPCINFACGWVSINSALPDSMQPNIAKVIVLPAWTTWRTFPVDLALPVGNLIPFKSLQWLQQYSKKTFRPLITAEQETDRNGHFTGKQKVTGFGPPTFQIEMAGLIGDRLVS